MTKATSSSPGHRSFAGVVLVGGSSTRMGRDKALLKIGDEPLASRVAIALLEAGADSVTGVGRDQGPSEFIDRWVVDEWPGEGPLGGVVTALAASTADLVTIVACDLPGASAAEIVNLVDSIGSCDVAMSTVDGIDQPLHAVWHRPCVGRLRTAFEGGIRSLRAGVGDLEIVRVEASRPQALTDVDTPDAFRSFLDGG